MTVRELIELLEDYDETMEVRIAHQPNYPLESSIAGVASAREAVEAADPEADENSVEIPNVVYIAEGRQLGYGDRRIWEVV